MEVTDLYLIWPFRLKKRHSTSLMYTDLCRSSYVTRPKRAVILDDVGFMGLVWIRRQTITRTNADYISSMATYGITQAQCMEINLVYISWQRSNSDLIPVEPPVIESEFTMRMRNRVCWVCCGKSGLSRWGL